MSRMACTYCAIAADGEPRVNVLPADYIVGGNSVCAGHANELLGISKPRETDRERRERLLRQIGEAQEPPPGRDLKRPNPLEDLFQRVIEDVE